MMQRLLAAVLAVTCVVASTPAFARSSASAFGHGTGGFARRSNRIFAPAPRIRGMRNRIPAPLPPPAEAPIINGPISQPAFQGMTGIGQ
jgi:hypothetical protein